MWMIIFQGFLVLQALKEANCAGDNDYLTVDLSGNLNLILTAPHGGNIDTLTPGIADRENGCYINGTCVFEHNCGTQDPTNCEVKTAADTKTDEVTELVYAEIFKLKEEYPQKVINHIHRKKLDPNRERDEATFGEQVPQMVYDWYHSNISAGISLFQGEPGILFDIHGYSNGNQTDWTMLGYMISKNNLNTLADDQLDLLVNDSSIRNLAAKTPNENFSNLLRDANSFGASMETRGLDAVPSPNNTGPGSAGYYSGGYTTKTYKDTIDAIQVEIHYYHRSDAVRRQQYAEQLAKAIVEFYNKHYVPVHASSNSTPASVLHFATVLTMLYICKIV